MNAPSLIEQGRLAVDIFFVLSGFILVYVYRDRFDVSDFLLKRFARLYPVHLVTLIGAFVLIFSAKLMGLQIWAELSLREVLIHLFALHSLGFRDVGGLNYPSWSISAEFSAYLAFPFIVSTVLRRDLRVVMPLVVIFFFFCFVLAEYIGRPMLSRTNDFSTLRIMPEFLMGMLAARLCLEERVPRRFAMITAVLLFGVGIFMETPLITVISAPFLIAALYLYDRPVPAPLRYLGLISYSLYMVHALVENAGFKIIEIAYDTEIAPLWSLPVVTTLAICAAAVLYHVVEVPCRRMLVSWGRRAELSPSQPGPSKP